MLSKTATAALGRVNQCTFSRSFVLSATKGADHAGPVDKTLVSSTQKALDLQKTDDPRVVKIAPLEVALSPLITELPQETKDRIYPQIGNRDIVGPTPGMLIYSEEVDRPLPAVRWGANTSETDALRLKEKGNWNEMTMAEKKQLYRHSFRQTLVEMEAPTGEGKKLLYFLIYGLGLTAFIMSWNRVNGYIDEEPTFTDEHNERMIKRMVREYRNPMTGVGSKYDYEKGCWK